MKAPRYDHPIWTPLEVWTYYRVSRSWVYRQLQLGNMPHIKIGGGYRIIRAVLEEWMKQYTVTPGEYNQ